MENEVHYDRIAHLVYQDVPDVIEIWNLVLLLCEKKNTGQDYYFTYMMVLSFCEFFPCCLQLQFAGYTVFTLLKLSLIYLLGSDWKVSWRQRLQTLLRDPDRSTQNKICGEINVQTIYIPVIQFKLPTK